MMDELNKVDRNLVPCESIRFMTLTVAKELFLTPRQMKKCWKRFAERLLAEFPDLWAEWKLEPHKSLVPHMHAIVCFGEVQDESALIDWLAEAWVGSVRDYRSGKARKLSVEIREKMLRKARIKARCESEEKNQIIEKLRSWEGVKSYAAKYLGKKIEGQGWENPGRYWGIIGREAFNKVAQVEYVAITDDVAALMRRTMRRFTERQPTGVWVVPGSKGRPGCVGRLKPHNVAWLVGLGIKPRQKRRRVRNRKLLMGMTVYLPASDADRLYRWASRECGKGSDVFRDPNNPAPF
uniref:Replication-associated protein ORF2/G2P domain-containing protein n=1 Tax=uncultured prokaryote TaxID=198431 RepID=A0A0H5QIA5_9ZZZZ|nr:hypothetical protein [uncultured prokaryote]